MRSDLATAHEALVESLISSGALRSQAVEEAFRRVRRHRFLDHWYRLEASRLQADWHRVEFDLENPDSESLDAVYSDNSLVTHVEGYLPTSSSSQPSLVSSMLEALDLRSGMRVLEIGTGTGFNAALLSELVGDSSNVFTVELQGEIAALARDALVREGYSGVHVIHAEAADGVPDGAPYGCIEATVGCPDISPRWLEQLAPDGRMLIPLQHGHLHPLVRIAGMPESSGHAQGVVIGHSAFMSVRGRMAVANPWQSYLIGGLPAEPSLVEALPIPMPTLSEVQDPLSDAVYRDFYFYLTLSSRELWRTNAGFGLADPSTPATVVVTSRGMETFFRGGGLASGKRLSARLGDLLAAWDRLGRPAQDAYEMSFVPRHQLPSLTGLEDREWVIERPYHWQIVHLPAPAG